MLRITSRLHRLINPSVRFSIFPLHWAYTPDNSYNDELLYDYETPTDDVVQDRWSNETRAERLDPTSDDDGDASASRHQSNNEGMVASHGRQTSTTTSDGLRIARKRRLDGDQPCADFRKLIRKVILKFGEAREQYLRCYRDSNAAGVSRSSINMMEQPCWRIFASAI
uniref:Uncharacterized protein n=1 Tax=Spongospora subterranea TaxID=70186 RepID=A0A0H5QXF7_9EUKA|eukprot:CRZ06291.1 hypothetical protein [Spongospora subterranea]